MLVNRSRIANDLGILAWGLLGGAATIALIDKIGGLSLKQMFFLAIGIGVIALALLSGRPKQWCLFAWVFSLTYNRAFYSFEALVGKHDSSGLYWIAADVFLVALLALWAYEASIAKRSFPPLGKRAWPWLLPFALVSTVSVLLSRHLDWGMFELFRLAKMFVILAYFRFNVGRREWWLVLAAFADAASLQACFGILELASQRTGIMWIFGMAQDLSAVPDDVRLVQENYAGFMRATGTMGHPPILANYMLLTTPVFIALSLTLRSLRWSALCTVLGIIGLVGQLCTLSRLPSVLTVLQLVALAVALVATGNAKLTRVIATAAIAGMLGTVAVATKIDLIHDRLTRDLRGSIDFRLRDNQIAVNILKDHPLLGIGLNNYAGYLREYGSEQAKYLEPEYQIAATKILHLRFIVGPLNVYLYIAAVTGVIGFLAFCVLLIGMQVVALRAIASTRHAVQAACTGMAVGLLGVYGEQMVDYSLWIDPILYSVTIYLGLLSNAPRLFGADTAYHQAGVVRV